MKTGLLSTTEVASMLKVNESTVKRWTDKGSLRCLKTPGGHRKYRMKDVVAFMDTFSYDTTDLLVPSQKHFSTVTISADYAILTKDYPVLSDIFLNTMLEGNREHTFQYLQLMYSNRISQTDIYDRIVFPAFAKIGMQWSTKELGIEQEHLASNTALHAINKLQDHIAKKTSHAGIALCGCLEDEYHEIGITCVNNSLEADGWTTYFLGPNLPTESIVDAIEQYIPTIVCVSSTTPKSKKQLLNACSTLYDTTQIINAKLIVGGLAAGDALKKKIPADLCPGSIADLMEFVRSLPQKK